MNKKDNAPRHIAIIMDGNGRWAKKRGLPRALGHKAGVEAVRKIVEYCGDIDLPYLTLYAFSTENFKRPADEVGALMRLLIEYLTRDLNLLKKNSVQLKILGDLSVFPKEVQKAVEQALQETADGKRMVLSIALGYGGRAELVQAFEKIARKLQTGELAAVSEASIQENLFTAGLPDPDLIIRTSGEMRLSNFLLFQSAYSELYFTDVPWPDFDEKQLQLALEDYSRRQRRYGGL